VVYGCVIFNNGWRSPDNAEGHGIYVQGADGNREVKDNLVFNNSGADLHIYENNTNYHLAGITLDGNVAFNAGTLQNVRNYRDILVGVDAPAISADRIVFKNNLGYLPPSAGADDAVQIGRDGINGGVAILNNYLPQGLEVNNWTIAAVSGNTVAAQGTNYTVSLNEAQASLSAAWNNNSYWVPPTGGGFLCGTGALSLSNTGGLSFSGWQNATGFDENSTSEIGNLGGTRVFIETNQYEAGRANITVYNWSNLTNVAVDVSFALTPGAPFEVRNAEDFFAGPVLSGVFSNQLLNLPMTGLSAAIPNGPMLAPQPTGPTFNVFVLLPRLVRLQALAGNGQVTVSWPTNAGNWILQSATNLSAIWADVTNTPALTGGMETVTHAISGNQGFFRLRPAP
jgi:hypothetical protein